MSFVWADDADARSRLPGFVDLNFSYLGRDVALSRLPVAGSTASAPVPAPSWRPLGRELHSTAASLQRLLQHADVTRLRTLLARYESGVHRLDDHGVRSSVARLIDRGTLGLFERTGTDPATASALALPGAREAQVPIVAGPTAAALHSPQIERQPLARNAPLGVAARLAASPDVEHVLPSTPLWAIEVVVLGVDECGISGVAFELSAGRRALRSVTTADGLVRFDGLPADSYEIKPYELDVEAWEPVSDEPLPEQRSQSGMAAAWQSPRPLPPAAQGRLHAVRTPETTDGLAFAHGLLPEAVWNHARNANLRDTRHSRNVLAEGDEIFLPPLQAAGFRASTGRRYVLRRRCVPARIRLRLLYDLHPWANLGCRLEVPGRETVSLTTDDDGVIEAFLPPDATRADLVYGPDATRQPLRIGALLPVVSDAGWRQRLRQLDFHVDVAEAVLSPNTIDALTRFQEAYGLSLTGEPDDETLERLLNLFDRKSGAPVPVAGVYAPSTSGE